MKDNIADMENQVSVSIMIRMMIMTMTSNNTVSQFLEANHDKSLKLPSVNGNISTYNVRRLTDMINALCMSVTGVFEY